MSVRRTVKRKPISVHGSFTVQDCQLLRKHSNVPILLQALSPLFSSYFPYVSQPLLHGRHIIDLDVGHATTSRHHPDILSDKLESVAVPGHNDNFTTFPSSPCGKRGKHIVRLPGRKARISKTEGGGQLLKQRPLLRKQVRHGFAVGFIRLKLIMTECLSRRIPGHSHSTGRIIRQDLHHHGGESVQCVGGKTGGGCDALRQSIKSPIGNAVPIQQKQWALRQRVRGCTYCVGVLVSHKTIVSRETRQGGTRPQGSREREKEREKKKEEGGRGQEARGRPYSSNQSPVLRSSGLRAQDSGAQDSGAQDLINLIGICVSYKWYAGDLGSFPTQAGKIASVQVIQRDLARAGHELLQALRQSGHVAIDPHRPIRNLTQVFISLPQMQVVIENLRPRLRVVGRMLGEVSVVHPLTYGAANHSSGQRRPSHAYHLHIGSAHSEGLEHMILKRQGTGDSHWGHIFAPLRKTGGVLIGQRFQVEGGNTPLIHHPPGAHTGAAACSVDSQQVQPGLGSVLDGACKVCRPVRSGLEEQVVGIGFPELANPFMEGFSGNHADSAVTLELAEGATKAYLSVMPLGVWQDHVPSV